MIGSKIVTVESFKETLADVKTFPMLENLVAETVSNIWKNIEKISLEEAQEMEILYREHKLNLTNVGHPGLENIVLIKSKNTTHEIPKEFNGQGIA